MTTKAEQPVVCKGSTGGPTCNNCECGKPHKPHANCQEECGIFEVWYGCIPVGQEEITDD